MIIIVVFFKIIIQTNHTLIIKIIKLIILIILIKIIIKILIQIINNINYKNKSNNNIPNLSEESFIDKIKNYFTPQNNNNNNNNNNNQKNNVRGVWRVRKPIISIVVKMAFELFWTKSVIFFSR